MRNRGSCGAWRGHRFHGQDLVKGLLPGDQADADQFGARPLQIIIIEVEPPCNRAVGVVAESFGIGDGDQKQVKRGSRVTALVDVMITDQPVIHPAELTGDLSDTVWTNGMLLDHHFLPWFELDH